MVIILFNSISKYCAIISIHCSSIQCTIHILSMQHSILWYSDKECVIESHHTKKIITAKPLNREIEIRHSPPHLLPHTVYTNTHSHIHTEQKAFSLPFSFFLAFYTFKFNTFSPFNNTVN